MTINLDEETKLIKSADIGSDGGLYLKHATYRDILHEALPNEDMVEQYIEHITKACNLNGRQVENMENDLYDFLDWLSQQVGKEKS